MGNSLDDNLDKKIRKCNILTVLLAILIMTNLYVTLLRDELNYQYVFTSLEPKTWFFRGFIYLIISLGFFMFGLGIILNLKKYYHTFYLKYGYYIAITTSLLVVPFMVLATRNLRNYDSYSFYLDEKDFGKGILEESYVYFEFVFHFFNYLVPIMT
jgi:succinate dehydrogenase hydrophobic anchor subunit